LLEAVFAIKTISKVERTISPEPIFEKPPFLIINQTHVELSKSLFAKFS
jgi:hypothetical protein